MVEPAEHIANAGVVGRGERGQRHLVIAGLFQTLNHRRDDLVGRALTHRAIRHAGLAKTTAAGAAAQDLDRQAVVDQLRIGHARLRQRIRGAEIHDDALVDHGRRILALTRHGVAMRRAGLVVTNLIERRHVVAGNGCKLLDNLRARDSFVTQTAMQLAGLEQRFLALADEDNIEEGRVRLGVVHRGAAGDDNGVVLGAVSR